MTPQEIFDKVWDHLNRQGVQSVSDDGLGCVYRASNGNMCAVGCLIGDRTAKEWEGKGVVSLRKLTTRLEPHRNLLVSLQSAHDEARRDYWLDDWRSEMKAISHRYNLTVPPIPEPTP